MVLYILFFQLICILLKVGMFAAGELGPFASVKLEIIWQPNIPGKVDSEFLITFSDPLSDSVSSVLSFLKMKTVDNILFFIR